MTASAIKDLRLTQFALGLMEGSGWYMPDYSYAEPTTWGKGEGCNFFDTTCIDTSTYEARFDEFCSPLASTGISWTKRGFGVCVGSTISSSISVPSYMNYWGNNTIVTDTFSDNCPYISTYSNMDCEDSDLQASALLTSYEYYGYGGKGFSGTMYPGGSLVASYGYCFKTNVI